MLCISELVVTQHGNHGSGLVAPVGGSPALPKSPKLLHWPGQQGGFVSYSESMCGSQGQGLSLGLEAFCLCVEFAVCRGIFSVKSWTMALWVCCVCANANVFPVSFLCASAVGKGSAMAQT